MAFDAILHPIVRNHAKRHTHTHTHTHSLFLHVQVQNVDAKAKSLTTSSGDTITFDKLIFAAGARPVYLSEFKLPGRVQSLLAVSPYLEFISAGTNRIKTHHVNIPREHPRKHTNRHQLDIPPRECHVNEL
jgi:hypothetical protein